MSVDTITIDGCDVVFSSGAAVSRIRTPIERKQTSDILLLNVSSTVTNIQLQSEISRFGSASVSRDLSKKRARVRFVDDGLVKPALMELDNKKLGLSRVETVLDRSKDSSWVDDGIVLEWDVSQVSALVTFASANEATDALRLNNSSFQGRKIRITQENDTTLCVEQLPAFLEDDDLISFMMAEKVKVTRVYNESTDIPGLLQVLVKEIPGYSIVRIIPFPTAAEQGAAWIRMYNPEKAATLATRLHGLKPIFLGGLDLRAWRAQAVTWALCHSHFTSARPLLENLQLERIYTHAVEESGKIIYRAVGSDLRYLRKAKYDIDSILNGDLWIADGEICWDHHWLTPAGKNAVIQAQIASGAYIRVDGPGRRIGICGEKENRDSARVYLQGVLEELDRQLHTLVMPDDLVRHFVEAGLPQLQGILHNFELKIGKQKVMFLGNDTSRHRLDTVIEQCANDLRLANNTSPKPICGICLSDVTNPVKFGCDHQYCRECLLHLTDTAKVFPITCINQECNYIPPITFFRRLLTPSSYNRLLEMSFRSYIRNCDSISTCPTPNCPEIRWVQEQGTQSKHEYQCSQCLSRICTRCNVEEHVGMTCEEQERANSLHRSERQFNNWKMENDVKNCPSCGRCIQKIEGCPHIACSQCHAHWCWECRRIFERPESVYAHIRRRHGWVGAPGIPMDMGMGLQFL